MARGPRGHRLGVKNTSLGIVIHRVSCYPEAQVARPYHARLSRCQRYVIIKGNFCKEGPWTHHRQPGEQ